jgi:hypothetical protein
MEKGLKNCLLFIACIWIVLLIAKNIFYSMYFCPVLNCASGPCYGCTYGDMLSEIVVWGLPSWALLLILNLPEDKRDKLLAIR